MGEAMTTACMGGGTSDMRKPCVSVIIIFLNTERFLAEAIDSVLAQSFGDFELLLVDDGSTEFEHGDRETLCGAARVPHTLP